MAYYADGDPLFTKYELRGTVANQVGTMLAKIDAIATDEILGTDPERLADYCQAEHTVEIPHLLVDDVEVEQSDAKVDVSHDRTRYVRDRTQPFFIPGTTVTFFVPFAGDKALFGMRPSEFSLNPPKAIVGDGELLLRYQLTMHDAEGVRAAFDKDLEQIQSTLEVQRRDIEPQNTSLRDVALNRIAERRDKLRADQGLVADLGFPTRRRTGAPNTYTVPTRRKRVSTRRPTPETAPAKPLEPELAVDVYEEILAIMDNMVSVMEQSPHAFITMGEEELRTHFLVQLNGQFEGNATGETFNYEGKTDILIKQDGRNIFIAECLVWNGAKSLVQKIDQLLGYASWRDTKTAIVVFSRRKNFSKVLSQIAPTVRNHDKTVNELEVPGESRFQFILEHRDDPERHLTLAVLAYDVPGE